MSPLKNTASSHTSNSNRLMMMAKMENQEYNRPAANENMLDTNFKSMRRSSMGSMPSSTESNFQTHGTVEKHTDSSTVFPRRDSMSTVPDKTTTTTATKRVRDINSSLPQYLSEGEKAQESKRQCNNDISPHAFLVSQLNSKGIEVTVRPSLSMDSYFVLPTQEQIDSYDHDVIHCIRQRDIGTLRRMHQEGRELQCCNRFGESLIHMACRRGFTEVASFLIHEAGVPVRVRDDYGRTPLHDACWTCEPNFELMDLLIGVEPGLLFLSDKRGHTPLQYVRRHDWNVWVKYLEGREFFGLFN